MAIYRKNQDLINIGAYPPGSSPAIDQAIRLHEPIRQFLRQPVGQGALLPQSWSGLAAALSAAAPAAANRPTKARS